MNTTEYYNIIEKTAKYPQEVKNFGLAYTVMGLFDEIGELLETTDAKSAVSEAGDVMWYIAAICKETGISFDDVITNHKELSPELKNQFKLLGLVKKYYRDDKPLNLELISDILKGFVNMTLLDAQDANITLEQILQVNYDKLTQRHATNTIQGDGETIEERLSNKS